MKKVLPPQPPPWPQEVSANADQPAYPNPPTEPGIYPCIVLTIGGPEAMCCRWDGDAWHWWTDAFDPEGWDPVIHNNCRVIAWELPMQNSGTVSMAAADVARERAHQLAKWGGPAHDDSHTEDDWQRFIADRIDIGTGIVLDEPYRHRLVEVAALAIAALESFDRKSAELAKPREVQS